MNGAAWSQNEIAEAMLLGMPIRESALAVATVHKVVPWSPGRRKRRKNWRVVARQQPAAFMMLDLDRFDFTHVSSIYPLQLSMGGRARQVLVVHPEIMRKLRQTLGSAGMRL